MGPVAHVGRGPPPAQHVVSRFDGTHLSAMARRPRPKVVTLTDAAAARIRELMAEKGVGFLRVGVKNAGCAGMEYTMSYAEAADPTDERVDDNGVSIVIDAKAVLFPARVGDRPRSDAAALEVHLHQPEPDRRLRLRRERHHRSGCCRVVATASFLNQSFRTRSLRRCCPNPLDGRNPKRVGIIS